MNVTNPDNKSKIERLIILQLADKPYLKDFKSIFFKFIMMLEDKFLQAYTVESSMKLLANQIKYEKYKEKEEELAIIESPTPRLLHVIVDLVYSESEVGRQSEFLTLQGQASEVKETYQKEMKTLFSKTKELDRKHAMVQHAVNFFAFTKKIIETKAFFEVTAACDDTRSEVKNDSKIAIAAAWSLIYFIQENPGYRTMTINGNHQTGNNKVGNSQNDLTDGAINEWFKIYELKMLLKTQKITLETEFIQKLEKYINLKAEDIKEKISEIMIQSWVLKS